MRNTRNTIETLVVNEVHRRVVRQQLLSIPFNGWERNCLKRVYHVLTHPKRHTERVRKLDAKIRRYMIGTGEIEALWQ